MKSGYTHATILVDRSGSMTNIADDMVGGIRSFIEEQRKVDGTMTVTYVTFDAPQGRNTFSGIGRGLASTPAHTTEFVGLDINDDSILDRIVLHPRGATALHDSQAAAIIETGTWLREMPEDERPERVMFITVTDGYENASSEYTADKVKALVDRQANEYAWNFVYLGANQDAFAAGSAMGLRQGQTMNYAATTRGVRSAYTVLAASTASYRGGDAWNMPESADDEEVTPTVTTSSTP